MQRVELEQAYIIHTRPYRDTSIIAHCLTRQHGMIGAVVRGQRQKKNAHRSLINPFIPLLVSMQGKGSLLLMTHFEASGLRHFLQGPALYSGLYLNELLLRLLPEGDAHPQVFTAYQDAVQSLAQSAEIEPVLRGFEYRLLQELGVGINWSHCAASGEAIEPEAWYRLDPEAGFIKCVNPPAGLAVLKGADILAVSYHGEDSVVAKRTAKRVNRQLLEHLLGAKPLRSRELFRQVNR
ncbi:DNA repair protein RecO [Gilvimarinus xylanilyticus]|uniref:DNA repair protein RecO n=1 Tax=Gilvimarinus xylanilyticus TaxID=2944139 RepID=A0A9X2I3R2_9GAMM|nr:DNA repair protein RecO [Gilvimarinus xylanilyticus]MCP8898897.1 DNA repair protein RecO [Gilvimarinus xylanilyticus]